MGSRSELVVGSWRAAVRVLTRPNVWWVVAVAVVSFPLLALLHAGAIALVALAVDSVFGAQAATQALVMDHGDAIYSRLVLSMVDSARPAGMAIGLPLDGIGWAGVVFPPGSSAVGIHLLEMLVDLTAVFVMAVLLGAFRGRPRLRLLRPLSSRPALLAMGLTFAFAAGAQLRLSWSGGSGGELALSMVATKILGIDGAAYAGALRYGWLLSSLINLTLIALCASLGFGLALLVTRLGPNRPKLRWPLRSFGRMSSGRAPLVAGLTGISLLVAPMQNRVVFQTVSPALSQPAPEIAAIERGGYGGAQALAAPGPISSTLKPPPVVSFDRPSVVTIGDHGYGFEYTVDGEITFVRGIGYNAQTKALSQNQRIARYDRDFAEISAMGANTVTGWDQSQFDETLLAEAAAHRLGVILPFELQPNWAYEDSRLRQQLLQRIVAWVERFRSSPALRMWGLGNEVVHGMAKAYPRRVPAFAEFLIEAADVIHRIDPNHPVIYRDAEDVFLPPVAAALHADGQARPWFVYGMNFFTARLADALTRGQAARLGQPLLISEFGPVGLRPADRPAGYERLWSILASHRATVVGGCAYVWTTAGPEPLDRGFGLTDGSGKPVDGSLAALSAAFAADSRFDTAAPDIAT